MHQRIVTPCRAVLAAALVGAAALTACGQREAEDTATITSAPPPAPPTAPAPDVNVEVEAPDTEVVVVPETAEAGDAEVKTYEAMDLTVALPADWSESESALPSGPDNPITTQAFKATATEFPKVEVARFPSEMLPGGNAKQAVEGMGDQLAQAMAGQGRENVKVVESTTWTHPRITAGKRTHLTFTDSSAQAGLSSGHVELFLGATEGGNLYVVSVLAENEADLARGVALVDGITFTDTAPAPS